MGPVLICDKCTLQGLSQQELGALRRYYTLNVPPVLLQEILADLAKEYKKGAPAKHVSSLANRIVPLCSNVSLDFRDLIQLELTGAPLTLRGVPIIAAGEQIVLGDGQQGMKIGVTEEEIALVRWQSGRFLEAEEMTAKLWRTSIRGIQLLETQRRLRALYPKLPAFKTLEEVAGTVDEIIRLDRRDNLVSWFLGDIGAPHPIRERLIAGLEKLPTGTLIEVAPYTHHCLRTALIFHFGLVAQGLIGTKDSNRIDLEYLFYSPLSNGFSSEDHFIVDMARVVLPAQTIFISGKDLKADLKTLAARWDGYSPEEYQSEQERVGPPEDSNSVTSQMWQRYMKPKDHARSRLRLTPEQLQVLVQKVTSFQISHGEHESDDRDFKPPEVIIRDRTVRPDTQCFCGSGLIYQQCHGRDRKTP